MLILLAFLTIDPAAPGMTAAQVATPATGSGFVGSWRVTPTIGGEAAVALTSFSADGLILTSNRPVQPATPGLPAGTLVQSLGQGSWQATGERTADITFVILQSDLTGIFLGTRTILGSLELEPSGDAWTGTFEVTIADPSGTVVYETTGAVHAIRIAVEPPRAGTPAPATPLAFRDAVEIIGAATIVQRG